MSRLMLASLCLCLLGCPPSEATDSVAPVSSRVSFLDQARETPLTPAEAALLHIVDSGHFARSEVIEAAKALAEIEKTRITTQSRELNRRVLELERR